MLVNHKLYDRTDEYKDEAYIVKTTKHQVQDITTAEVDAMSWDFHVIIRFWIIRKVMSIYKIGFVISDKN
ncbi:hypothetical protein Q5M85_19910 [Paraclostridium bifermentans]|nr:hypothetical protein [Paraclostridium bifermentans]